jgi:hypothetical protein
VSGETFGKDSFVGLVQCFKLPPLVSTFVLLLEFVWIQADHVPDFNSDQEVKFFNILEMVPALDQFALETDRIADLSTSSPVSSSNSRSADWAKDSPGSRV